MITGNGSFVLSQKETGGGNPAPPFNPTSANEGLSVDPVTGKIVLGYVQGDPVAGVITTQREIDIDPGGYLLFNSNLGTIEIAYVNNVGNTTGFYITGSGSKSTSFAIDDLGLVFSHSDGLNNGLLLVDESIASIGGNRAVIEVNGSLRSITGKISNNSFFLLDETNSVYRMGDLSSVGAGNFIEIDDINNMFRINNTANNISVEINGTMGITAQQTSPTFIEVIGGIVTQLS